MGERSTSRFQTMLDRCAHSGGGTVVFPAGRHITGTLTLPSRVHVVLPPGCTLVGSDDLTDYPCIVAGTRSYSDNYTCRSVIYSEGSTDVSISGGGTIDGGGAAFVGRPYLERPYLMRFVGCERVRVHDLRLVDSAMWVQHYLDCTDVVLDGLTVTSYANINNDGIDIDSSRRVRIANCSISTEDDAIVVKATAAEPCRDVVVTNCVLESDCNAFKIGTESVGDISDIVVSNCSISRAGRSALAIETVDGGSLRRVLISNVAFRDAVGGIFVRLGHRGRPLDAVGTADDYDEAAASRRNDVGTLSDVVLSNIVGHGCDSVGCSITGQPGAPLRNITLANVALRTAGGGGPVETPVSEAPEKYPEYDMFGPLPASGLYIRHVDGLRLTGLDIAVESDDGRPAMLLDDVQSFSASDESLALVHTTTEGNQS